MAGLRIRPAEHSAPDSNDSTIPAPAADTVTVVPGQTVIVGGQRYRVVVDELTAVLEPEREAARPSSSPPPAPHKASAARRLTNREAQIARLISEGMVNKQVANELGISEWTVSAHLRRIFAKFGVETRAAMVCAFVKAGVALES
ncbi:MAG TPA: helix-turn-helix transcriptional regulator [Polyangiaceae bacterium]|jgi:DNA-binding CsgD family transcriptional regulator|nr:helix-turn-helix transcriptional regulator [Polyangiaceae bacterium]